MIESLEDESESDEEASLISLSQLTWSLHNEKENDVDSNKKWDLVKKKFLFKKKIYI